MVAKGKNYGGSGENVKTGGERGGFLFPE